jgi:hypothetical protein
MTERVNAKNINIWLFIEQKYVSFVYNTKQKIWKNQQQIFQINLKPTLFFGGI